MRTNYHTHTPRCRHAGGKSAADYAKKAYELKYDILGFSDHAAFPDVDLGYRMPYSEMFEYFDEVDELRKIYAPKGLKIYKGLEIEFLPEYLYGTKDIPGKGNYYEYLLNDVGLDYMICGEHFFRSREGTLFNIYNLDGSFRIVDYAMACKAAMETGYFKILAHPDLFGVNDYKWDKNLDRACDIIIEAAVRTGTIVEFNANGFRRGITEYSDGPRYMYPLNRFWDKVKESGAAVIVGSDSHNPLEMWDYAIEKAAEYLGSRGIVPVETI